MRKYYRRVLFTKTPLKRSFRYRDKFQILPLNSERAPKSPFTKHFPLFLEYYLDIEDKNISKSRVDNYLTDLSFQHEMEFEIMNLLSVFSNHRFFKYNLDRNIWGKPTPSKKFKDLSSDEKDKFSNNSSSWIICGYLYPDLKKDLEIKAISEFDTAEIEFISPYYEYFTRDPVENDKLEIKFPETINHCLDNYYSLSSKTLKKIKSSIALICDGIDIVDYKRSLGFLSFVSAIEAFVSLEISDKNIDFNCKNCNSIKDSPYRCPKCDRPIWGIKAKFKEFLSKFVAGSDDSVAKYNKIYNLRSKITHQGQLFISDYELSLENMDKKETDWLMRMETLQLARISLTNWLIYEKKTSR